MPQIVKLQYNENMVSVEFDSGEVFRISYDVYTQYKLSSGMDIQGDAYVELHDESERNECRTKAYKYLGTRAHSIDEMKKYLKKKNFSEKNISDTVEYLKEKGYLNDLEYALAFVRERVKSGKYGKDLISSELYRKGITRKYIEKAIRDSGASEPDTDALYAMAIKKYQSLQEKANPLVKVGNYLRQRGFDYDSISVVLRKLKEEIDR